MSWMSLLGIKLISCASSNGINLLVGSLSQQHVGCNCDYTVESVACKLCEECATLASHTQFRRAILACSIHVESRSRCLFWCDCPNSIHPFLNNLTWLLWYALTHLRPTKNSQRLQKYSWRPSILFAGWNQCCKCMVSTCAWVSKL